MWNYPDRGSLPDFGRYVLCERKRGGWRNQWGDKSDQDGVHYVVAKRVWAKQEGNNERPYQWREFGPSIHFGQDILRWMEIPRQAEGA